MKVLLNLYDEIRPQHVRYNLAQLGAVLGVLLLVLAAWGVYVNWSVRTLALERASLESDEQTLTPQVESLQAQLASDDRLAVLRRRIDKLTLELQGRERMQALIADLSGHESSGFADVLLALADASRNDAWLTGIAVSGPRAHAPPERVHLRGRLLDAQALARYLDALAQQSALEGLQFATVIVGDPNNKMADDAAADSAAADTSQPLLTFELDSQVQQGGTP